MARRTILPIHQKVLTHDVFGLERDLRIYGVAKLEEALPVHTRQCPLLGQMHAGMLDHHHGAKQIGQ